MFFGVWSSVDGASRDRPGAASRLRHRAPGGWILLNIGVVRPVLSPRSTGNPMRRVRFPDNANVRDMARSTRGSILATQGCGRIPVADTFGFWIAGRGLILLNAGFGAANAHPGNVGWTRSTSAQAMPARLPSAVTVAGMTLPPPGAAGPTRSGRMHCVEVGLPA